MKSTMDQKAPACLLTLYMPTVSPTCRLCINIHHYAQATAGTRMGVSATVVTAGHCTHAELTSGRALASCYSCCMHSCSLC